jgi:hypothetical protein
MIIAISDHVLGGGDFKPGAIELSSSVRLFGVTPRYTRGVCLFVRSIVKGERNRRTSTYSVRDKYC